GCPTSLLRELQVGEPGYAHVERTVGDGEHAPDPPVDDDVVTREDSGSTLLEVLLEPRDRGRAPRGSVASRVPDAAERVDERPEPRASIARRARLEVSRRRPERELDLAVEIR